MIMFGDIIKWEGGLIQVTSNPKYNWCSKHSCIDEHHCHWLFLIIATTTSIKGKYGHNCLHLKSKYNDNTPMFWWGHGNKGVRLLQFMKEYTNGTLVIMHDMFPPSVPSAHKQTSWLLYYL